jgi:hypothetical protein
MQVDQTSPVLLKLTVGSSQVAVHPAAVHTLVAHNQVLVVAHNQLLVAEHSQLHSVVRMVMHRRQAGEELILGAWVQHDLSVVQDTLRQPVPL